MPVLMLSIDKNIFVDGSNAQKRMMAYGTLFEGLHIVVFTGAGFKEKEIAPNVFIYPTNTRMKLLYFWDAYGVCEKLLKKFSGLLVTSQDAMTNMVAFLLRLQFHFRLQVQVHTDFLSPYFKTESLKNYFRYWGYVWGIQRADCIRVVSKRIYDSLGELGIRNYESRTTIMPIFVDAQKILDASPSSLSQRSDFTILWVGRFEPEKNPMLALEAFRELVKKVPRAKLIIVGDGSLRKKLELQTTNYKLQTSVIFDGWKDTSAGYYKSADVLLVTSWYEGYGMAMVEARIAGLPVVAPDVGVAREVGAHITNYKAEEMADTLEKIYNKELALSEAYRYPYTDKEDYLRAYKQSFEQCLKSKKM